MLLSRRSATRSRAGLDGSPDPVGSATPAASDVTPADAALAEPRSSLRLVRFRLALALLAAAVVPIALATPLMVRIGQQIQAGVGPAESSAASARVASQLTGFRERLLATREADAVGNAIGGSKQAKAKAVPILDSVARPEPNIITGVWLVDERGRTIVAGTSSSLAADRPPLPVADASAAAAGALGLPSGARAHVAVVNRPEGAVLYLATPVVPTPAKGRDPAVLLARLSIPALLAEAQTGLGGSVVAYASTPTRARVVLEPDTNTLDTPPGERVPIDAPGFEDWSIAIRPRPIQFDFPLPLLLLVFVLSSAAVAIVWWLARQVIDPAERLERASAKLGQLYETARNNALEDSLTGLGNHRAFMEEFDRQLEESRRYNRPVALLLLDLDDFKLVNDSAGHAVGDRMLVEMGRLLRATLRRSDRPFRIGGDEFAVLMPHTTTENALLVGRRLLASCTEPRPASAFPRPFAFSAGISACPEFSRSRSELFGQADAALYDGKRHGRTTVTIFDPNRARLDLDPQARSELSTRVAHVVAVGALRAVYQPVVDLRTGRVVGFEGLVRPAPDSGFDNASSLFAAAEASGRTLELDRACIEEVIRGARQLAPDQTLSINISPRSLEAPEFNVGSLVALLTHHGIEPHRVTLELTEREAVEDLDRLRAVTTACQAAGLKIAADDVGAGNAGLRLLSQIHFDIVKIDLSLVQEGEQREGSLAILRALTELANRWGAMVVAEGVETPGQLWVVQELGMSAAQGYLLGRPADTPAHRFVDLGALLALDGGVEPAVFRPRAAMPVV